MTRWNYAGAICNDTTATLAELREAVNTLEEVERTARRVLGGSVIHQVHGAFEDLIRGAARGRYFREKSKRTRDGIVPDLRWRAEDGEFVLGDVKTIGFGKTRYWGRSPASMRAVDSRAASVNTDMRSRLRTIDREILGRHFPEALALATMLARWITAAPPRRDRCKQEKRGSVGVVSSSSQGVRGTIP